MKETLTKNDCIAILDRWKHWNTGQVSLSVAHGGARTVEDDILDERRQLVLIATRRLKEISDGKD